MAGIGGALGEGKGAPWAIPVGDGIDPDGKRTSQRAELLAAIEGLYRLSEDEYDHGITPRPPSRTRRRCLSRSRFARARRGERPSHPPVTAVDIYRTHR